MPPNLVVPLTPPSDMSRSVASFLESPATRLSFQRQSGLLMEMPSAKRLKAYDCPDDVTTVSIQSLISSNPLEEKIKVSLEPTREFQSIQGLSDKLDFFINKQLETTKKLDETNEKLDEIIEKVNSHEAWIRQEEKAKLPVLIFNALEDFVNKIYMINKNGTTTESGHIKKNTSQPGKALKLGSQTQGTTVNDHSLSTTRLIQAAEMITKDMLKIRRNRVETE
ncbi:MAG: hypothetical protein LQ350_004381 [Teloschistes chrysophthalmus]|nr:MAG: hypothetical protein LQ350_004381 [Niorma chrysophthalma]